MDADQMNHWQAKSMKRSGWIAFVVVVQIVYALFLIAIPVCLLLLAYGWGAVIASAAMGGPGILAFIGWFGLRKGKFWGWSITLFADLTIFGILTYSLIDDGWHHIDWELMGMAVLAGIVSAALLIPVVRRSYWQGAVTQPALSS